MAVTPLGGALRFAGTLELAGLDESVDRRRVAAVRRAVSTYHACDAGEPARPPVEGPDERKVEIWRGLRPCLPDGLPAVGRTGRCEDLLVATGHAMKGICQAPATGRLVAQLLVGERPLLDPAPLSPDRFT